MRRVARLRRLLARIARRAENDPGTFTTQPTQVGEKGTMNLIKFFAAGVLALGMTVSSAAAFTEAEQQQIDQLVSSASDITRGAQVGDATIIARGGTLLPSV